MVFLFQVNENCKSAWENGQSDGGSVIRNLCLEGSSNQDHTDMVAALREGALFYNKMRKYVLN